ncbi:nitrogen regulation protein NR(I) [Paraferrimonas sedimenticola]|uniref:DNA-binding transcriptional regulator NtrC n=1 Tax=Paraferrimonas sedimenticola TaxID=375674 RepID=A0AA37RYE2_9GAMM|nr:nitrogen regulation protein NR(I) [Paraferrimonas sedimenticola]GLP97596.1 nitrogen regulation protein NR(I) [Paraferrimonas sedimenticola]
MSEQIWILDDDSSIRWVLERALTSAGLSCSSFAAADSLWQALESSPPQVIISDIRMPDIDGLTLLEKLQQHYPQIPVIIITAHSDLDSAVNAYQSGAFEYLPKPFDIDEAVALAQRALNHCQEQAQQAAAEEATTVSEIIGEAPAMQEVFRAIGRLSKSSISVLINGQSGTGKELVANALHKHSPRSQKPFIALNMAAIPHDLIESELFGHEKGAFTGAGGMRKGRFEQADGGTLFLDEIGDMPLAVQTRLLRVLADGQFYRVGGHTPVSVDVRIIAATHQDLETRVAKGEFREDLFHRLNVIRIHLPSLSQRREDIAKLAQHFLQQAAAELAVEPKSLSLEAQHFMSELPWPGNVRQLENTCRWLTVMASGQEILVSDMPPELVNEPRDSATGSGDTVASGSWQAQLQSWVRQRLQAGDESLLQQAQPEFERILLTTALEHTKGHKQAAAKLLGWGRNTLTRKLKDLGMNP